MALLALGLLSAAAAEAATYAVTSTGDQSLWANRDNLCQIALDKSPCTLRAAIQLTNSLPGADTIFFALSTSDANYSAQTGSWTIPLTAPLPDIATDSLTITGPGASKMTIRRLSGGEYRLFNVTTLGTVSFSGLTLTGGRAPLEGFRYHYGGAIRNLNGGTVNVTNCILSENSTGAGFSSYSGFGGAISNRLGTMTIRSSTFRSNRAVTNRGVDVLRGFSNAGGGAIDNGGGTLTVIDSTFELNESLDFGGAILNTGGIVNISGSTFRENIALQYGGALADYLSGTLSVSNSTFYANLAHGGIPPSRFGSGGAIAAVEGGTVNVTNSTVTANFAGIRGSGLSNEFGIVNVKSSLIAQNLGGRSVIGAASANAPDVRGAFNSQGFNLIGKTDGSTGFTLATDRKGTIASPLNPKFDSRGLRNNGGPTLTVALTATSPAVDRGTSLGLTGILSTDQRGAGFLRKVDKAAANAAGGDGTDIGAYELQ